jgi:nucleotide sugar dehydrogenase
VNIKNIKIGIIGLGYVGLPLAIEFSKITNVVGYDLDKKRVIELKEKKDRNFEVKKKNLTHNKKLKLTSDIKNLSYCNFFIVTLPTPIKKNKEPDLKILINGTKNLSKIIKKNSVIVYESTVYPGCTEDICVPIINKYSGLKYNKDFFCGYSPERINVGDKAHNLTNVKKIVSGSNAKTLKLINYVYSKIIKAGTFPVKNIKIAESAKIIENVQRDLNIALINEISIIFDKLSIDTRQVIEAAKTKWNYIDFKPGMVGGHCIGVDPYYLTYKAKNLNYSPKIILSGRKINDSMSSIYFNRVKKISNKNNINLNKKKVLVMGLSFKENCNDIRNSKIIDLIKNFEKNKCKVEVFDPWVSYEQVKKMNINLIENVNNKKYDFIIICVAHKIFKNYKISFFNKISKKKTLIFDIKDCFNFKKNNFFYI